MQTILGAGGVIGTGLANVLPEYTKKIRLVSRNPQKVNASDELFKADLTVSDQVDEAVKGSEVVYLVAGLPYKAKIWESTWPVIMKNTVEACKKQGCRLVFFDNIYMYDGSDLSDITEDTPVNPPSRKGKVRAEIAGMLMKEAEKSGYNAAIARSADFYGPGANSVLMETVVKNLKKGKTANWLGKPECKHSFTYTPDAAKATAMIGNNPDAFGEVWHLPTASDPPTGHEWVEIVANELDVKPKSRAAGKGMVSFLGLFMPLMKEMKEMMYQYDQDYVFNSSKFEKHFKFSPTPYAEGIKQIIRQI